MVSHKTISLARAAGRDLLVFLEACRQQAWETGQNQAEVNALVAWLYKEIGVMNDAPLITPGSDNGLSIVSD